MIILSTEQYECLMNCSKFYITWRTSPYSSKLDITCRSHSQKRMDFSLWKTPPPPSPLPSEILWGPSRPILFFFFFKAVPNEQEIGREFCFGSKTQVFQSNICSQLLSINGILLSFAAAVNSKIEKKNTNFTEQLQWSTRQASCTGCLGSGP